MPRLLVPMVKTSFFDGRKKLIEIWYGLMVL